jgi:hypothetical protein
MPKTYNGYVWSHWLEDGVPNRIKTIVLPDATWTGVFVTAPSPKPVGGFSFQTEGYLTTKPLAFYLALATIITTCFAAVKRRIAKKT